MCLSLRRYKNFGASKKKAPYLPVVVCFLSWNTVAFDGLFERCPVPASTSAFNDTGWVEIKGLAYQPLLGESEEVIVPKIENANQGAYK